MKQIVWLLLLFSIGVSAQGVYPHQFTEKTTLTDSDWETYSQKSGLPRRISPPTMSAYFLKGVRAYVSGDVLYFSRRDSISSVSLAAYKQTLSVAVNGGGQTTVSISNGNTITLPAASVGDIEVEAPIEGTGSSSDPLGITDLGIATGKIADNAVTYSKIQQVTSGRLLGRYSAGSGTAQEITLGSGLSLSIGGELSASGGGGNGIYGGSGSLPNDTVKATNTLRFKLKDPANSNGTTFFNRSKSAYSFVPSTYTDSLNQGLLIKKGLDSAAVAIDKDGNLQLLSNKWAVLGNPEARIITRRDDPFVVFEFTGGVSYTFPNDQPSVSGFNNVMVFNSSGSSQWVNTSTFGGVSEYNVAVSGANSGSNLRIKATSTGVTASYASNKLTIVIPGGTKVFSADWRLVSADIQASADAAGTTNWVLAEFQGTGGNTSVDNLRVPNIQKTSIPTSGALSVTNSGSVDIDNNPAISIVGAASGNIIIRVGGLSAGGQGYHLKFTEL
jgi:hypothetical protein